MGKPHTFPNGSKFIEKKGMWAFVDENGKEHRDRYDDPRIYNGHIPFAVVAREGLYGIINDEGIILAGFSYTEVGEFKCGRLLVGIEPGLFGYLNESFKVAVEPKYKQALGFVGGSAFVREYNKWRLIGAKGEYLTDYVFDAVLDDGIYPIVKSHGKCGRIDRLGNVEMPFL